MFDHYEPVPALACPRCGRTLDGWQGKDAENALFVWKQHVRHPTEQCIADDDVRLAVEDLGRFTLPAEFRIYTHCTCSTEFFLEAFGTTIDDVWSQTRPVQPDDIDRVCGEMPRAQRAALRKWLSERV